jgi:inorganic pyrophosphatase
MMDAIYTAADTPDQLRDAIRRMEDWLEAEEPGTFEHDTLLEDIAAAKRYLEDAIADENAA